MEGVDDEEDQEARGERQREVDPAALELPQERQPEEADRHGQDADVHAHQREGEQRARIRRRRLHGDGNLVIERDAVRRYELHLMRLAHHPGVRQVDRRPAEPGHSAAGRHREPPERLVHHHLRHRDRVRPAVDDGEGDVPGREARALHRQRFDGRDAARQRREQAAARHDDRQAGEQQQREQEEEETTTHGLVHLVFPTLKGGLGRSLPLRALPCRAQASAWDTAVTRTPSPRARRTAPSTRAPRIPTGGRGT